MGFDRLELKVKMEKGKSYHHLKRKTLRVYLRVSNIKVL
jgi:hypothetical protein